MFTDNELQESKQFIMKQFGNESQETEKNMDILNQLSKETSKMYRCGHCGSISTSDDINKCTMDTYCMNRKQRREYVPIEKTKLGNHRWYKCPRCSKNVSRRNGWYDAIPSIRMGG